MNRTREYKQVYEQVAQTHIIHHCYILSSLLLASTYYSMMTSYDQLIEKGEARVLV